MPRRTRRMGHLVRKKKKITTITETFRVLAEKNTDLWLEAEFNTFDEAKAFIDSCAPNDIQYYVYNDNNRVLYSREGD
tara:strand:+ start:955 stop:1188 length:234 start_codon:yes stop_codon:yes gene_type:complete